MVVLHGNHLESLRTLAVEWIRKAPLAPLENETILVQSNGMAQWLRLALAAPPDATPPGCGIAAALDMQLPSRFVWSAYRAVLGADAVPQESPYAKRPLTWRLMRLLPECLEREAFAPLHRFLQDDDPGRGGDLRKRFQLAERLADLLDQYQVYRADWLMDWAARQDVLRDTRGQARALAPGQCWQAELWRLLQADIGPVLEGVSRAAVHARYLEAVRTLETRPAALPRRIIVFGISSLPGQILEALEGLARFCQVLVCVHNPCQYYWADIVADKDLLRAQRRRQARKAGMPETLEAADLHNHAHPLLAAWGKQGRDYIGLLDEHDDPANYDRVLGAVDWSRERVDVFEAHGERGPGDCLLHQLQDDIRALRPLAETRDLWPPVGRDDRSLQFHVAHGPLREVELLHDRLLDHFKSDSTLRPRDVIVMVPDIDQYAPHIEAVFGQPDRHDRRYIPYTLSDQGPRGRDPVLIALEQLLGLPESRMGVGELLDLLDVPAVRRRFGIAEEDLMQLHRWAEGAGVRWGLAATQRAGLGLPEGLDQNTWRFGLRRMLLGYALGDQGPWQDIEPFDEIGGLSAALLGPLEALIRALEAAWEWLRQPHAPEDWARRLGGLLVDFFDPGTDAELETVEKLRDALEQWREDCAAAALEEPLPLAVVREQWLASQDDSGVGQRFLAGSVNFCTLMPMRAIPFQVVCLLGMNDGDYPRSPTPVDFDLMAQDYRPGDRSRREDDRYLFLEALLSARRQLHVSWVGRHVRDNESRPPSVLVGQLRDHLAAGWSLAAPDVVEGELGAGAGLASVNDTEATDPGQALVRHLTLEHPLQPFSPQNFPLAPEGARHYTFAREWEAVHNPAPEAAAETAAAGAPVPLLEAEREPRAVGPEALARFLRFPVEAFFRHRLGVFFDEEDPPGADLEPFGLDGLEQWQVRQHLVAAALETTTDPTAWPAILATESARLQRAGRLPLGAAGALEREAMVAEAERLLERIGARHAEYPDVLPAGRPLRLECAHWSLEAVPPALRGNAHARVCLDYSASRIADGKSWRFDKLMVPWVLHLLANTGDGGVGSELVALDTQLQLPGLEAGLAEELLATLLEAWVAGQERPLPLACGAGFAWLVAEAADRDPWEVALRTLRGSDFMAGEWSRSPALARAWPDPETLLDDPDFGLWRDRLYRPLFVVLNRTEDAA
ncbi:exodeoxyribonuclease V subunit gamma [Thioalkalivibrio sp. ALJ16]|uniref:exodeoxyribonuclease V subunit gamma n=1 Tax=Thioalkalivibrio sp. ALJ16 TaxID=1158762 RepID=UPI00035FDE4C|nr:exodeoxyribonuclease V subunit gamma [Thioalkalivibrio sp. ALJ16]